MHFKFICTNCGKVNKLKGSFLDRRELSEKLSRDDFKLICISCNRNVDVNANEIKAEESKLLGLLFVLIFIPAIVLGYYLFTGFFERSSLYLKSIAIFFALIIPAGVYFTAVKAEQKKVRDFNRYKI